MIAADEDALICDLAETYGILDHRALPASKLAVLSAGLRESSRIKMQLSGTQVPTDTLLLATVADRLGFLAWAKTTDGQKGINRPQSLPETMLPGAADRAIGYDTPEAFEAARQQILREVTSINGE